MKCPECANEFNSDNSLQTVTCPNCNKQVSTDKAIKYYQSLNKINAEKEKSNLINVYQQITSILDKCQFYLDNENFNEVIELTDMALKLHDSDSRVYLMRVYAKTKNFTDYQEDSHFYDLKKAIELSTTLEKEQIKKIYNPYHKKRNIPKEEFEDYENQESQSRLNRVEELLKDQIPNNFAREKFVKKSLPLVIITASACLICLILSMVLDNLILSLVSAGLFVAFALLLVSHLNGKTRANRFNAVLDLYDGLLGFNLTPSDKVKIAIVLEKYAIAEINNENTSYVETLLFQMVEILVESNKIGAKSFIKSNKVFSKYQ